MLKIKILVIILACMLISPVIAEEPNPAMSADEREVLETVYPQADEVGSAQNIAETAEQKEVTETQIPHKPLISKRKIAKKFLFAMLGVGISSVLIFGILTLYNKVREGFMTGHEITEEQKEPSLETPDNLTDAVKTFLDKTHWE